MIVDAFEALLGFKYSGAGDARQFQNDLDKTAAKAESAARRVTTAVADFGDGLSRSLRGPMLAIGAIAAGATSLLGKNVINLSAQFESYAATLETVEGSAEKAKNSLDWAASFAKKTPYDLAQVTEAFIKMRAYGLDPMDGSMTALGDGASAMGKTLMEAVEAMADAVNGEQERLKEFGITSKTEGDKITYSWNKNGQTFSKTIRKNGEEIAKFIREHMSTQFGGAMLRQSTTWNGMMSNLGDSWDDFQRRIGRGGFFETVKNRLGDLLDYIEQLDASGKLDEWSRRLSTGFKWAADQITFSVQNLGTVIGSTDLSDKLKPFLTVMGLLVARVFPVATAFALAALAFEDWLAYMAGADSAIGDFVDAMAKFFGTNPEQMATILGNIATAAGWLIGGALGLTLFASALRSLSGALMLVSAAKGAVSLLGSLAGLKWGGAASAAGAAAEATSPAKKGGAGKAGGIGAGRATATGFSTLGMIDILSNPTPQDAADRGARWNAWANENVPTPRSVLGLDGPAAPSQPRGQVSGEGRQALAGIVGRLDGSATAMAGMLDRFAPMITQVLSGMRPGGGLEMVAKMALQTEAFMAPANQVKAMMYDIERTYTAKVDVNTDAAMAKIAALKAEIGGLGTSGMRRMSHSQQNDGRPFERAKIVESPASR